MIKKKLKKRDISIIVIFFILLLFSNYALSEKIDVKDTKNAYIIIINRLTLTDIEKMPNVIDLVDDGSIGLMNTRGAKGYDGPQGYITINSSKRAFANYDSGLFFNINQSTINSYKRRTGQDLNDSQIINPEINSLINLNKDSEFSPFIGALGDNLNSSGYKTAVFGNSDTADSFVRTNCLIATDSAGRIDYGNVDDILTIDEEFCYGYRTDYSKLYNEVIDVTDEAHLIVIETGDLNRLSSCKEKMSDEMFLINRNKVLSKIDGFIGTLVKNLERDKSLVLIVSPNREESSISNSKLSPVIIWGSGINKGVVTSGTTRREGLISNIDIAPTITTYFNGSNINFIGQPIMSNNKEMAFDFLKELSEDINSTSLTRNKILNIYNVIVIIAPLITLVFLFFRKQFKSSYYKIFKGLLLSIIAIPLGFLLISIFDIKGYFSYYLIILLFVLILSIIMIRINGLLGLLVIASIITITITLDLLTGANLIKSSVLGYDPIIGARYFGIGNEVLGVLLGTITILCGIYLDLFKKHYYILVFLVIIFLVVLHPDFGANFGGSIAIIFTILMFLIRVFNIRITFRTIFSMMGLISLVLILVVVLDAFISINPSHLGKTLIIIIRDNPLYIFEVISRKLSMNIRLISITIWSKTLYLSLIYILLNLLIFRDTVREFFNKNKCLTAGFISTMGGSLIGFLVNDSGIIMASLSIIYVTMYLLYVTINEVEKMDRK